MTKLVTLTDITSGYLSNEQISGNFDKITTAFQNTVSRDGSSPNTLTSNLDMNGNQLINLATPTTDYNAATKKYVDDNSGGIGDVTAAVTAAQAAATTATTEAGIATTAATNANTAKIAAQAAQAAAEAAAGTTLPALIATDTGKTLIVNAGGTGYDLFSSGTTGQFFTSGGADASPTWSTITTTVPTGAMMDYAGTSAPSGWLLCYGQAVSRTTYSTLFGILSTSYGAGDASTTFNLPDCRGRVRIGLDNLGGSSADRITAVNADSLNNTGGGNENTTAVGTNSDTGSHTLSVSEVPALSATVYTQFVSNGSTGPIMSNTSHAGYSSSSLTTNGGGGSHSHNGSTFSGTPALATQPWVSVSVIIKT